MSPFTIESPIARARSAAREHRILFGIVVDNIYPGAGASHLKVMMPPPRVGAVDFLVTIYQDGPRYKYLSGFRIIIKSKG